MLIVATLISYSLGETVNASILLFIILMSVAIDFYQEQDAEKTDDYSPTFPLSNSRTLNHCSATYYFTGGRGHDLFVYDRIGKTAYLPEIFEELRNGLNAFAKEKLMAMVPMAPVINAVHQSM